MKVIALTQSEQFKHAVLDILKSAEHDDEITANYFSIRNDAFGHTLLHHLYQAAIRGVRVRLIIDDYACLHASNEGTDYHSKALDYEALLNLDEVGVEIHNYHPIETPKMFHLSNISNWSNFSRRNHNKNFIFNLKKLKKRGIIIGDSQWVQEHFNGDMLGSNLYIEDLDTYLDALSYTEKLLRSNHVERLRYGTLNREKIIAYEKIFKFPCELLFDSWSWYKDIITPKSIRFVYSDIEFVKPKKRHTIQNYEIDLIKRAKKEIWYCTPYFSPDEQMQEVFEEAQENKELNLNIFIGKYKNDPYLPYGVRKVARRLLKHGINIFEYNAKGNIHYKDMVVDDHVFVKTANGEGRSRFYNLETGVIIKSKQLANVLKQRIQMDLNSSVKVELQTDFLQKQSYWQRVKGITLCPLYFHHL